MQIPGVAGAGSGHKWYELDFVGGACAARMHRRPICGAGSGTLFRLAPVTLGTGAGHPRDLRRLDKEPAPQIAKSWAITQKKYDFYPF